MKVTITPTSLVWVKLKHEHTEVCKRLSSILESWSGTRYMIGLSQKGFGVDCVNFVFGVLDEMYREKKMRRAYSAAMCMNNPKGAFSALRTLLDDYQPNESISNGTVEPGDIIVTSTKVGAPGHVMIAGPEQSELWHVYDDTVCTIGLGFFDSSCQIMNYFRTFRSQDKEKWV